MNSTYSTDNECLLTGGLWSLVVALVVAAVSMVFVSFGWAVALFVIVFAVSYLITYAMCKTRTVGRGAVDMRAIDLARAEMGMAPHADLPDEPAPAAAPAPAPAQKDHAEQVGAGEAKPKLLTKARGGKADDLKKIKGVGPKLEKELNAAGVYHFDQVAGWSAEEILWADQHLVSFKGRVSRDNWVEQAKELLKD